ncbi:unnamed protein product [Parascedosporium putredinis]|uniref:ubiquitinyl hydrolase 1 n=1 Tax=Parascedosporium putredinis TaxID=1442378 RepID=A0A9P1H2A9_9PEZI|nr:unnamed protein product [Parascedosporium putredinis]CAI7993449.1 unnamed protein product [Parascedosporium putredinis]
MAQWPCGRAEFSYTSTHYARWETYLRFNAACEVINQRVKLWHQNRQLYEYLDEIVETIPSTSPLPRVKDNLRAVARSSTTLEEVSGLDTTYQWAQSCTAKKAKADEGTTPSSVGVLINTLASMAEAGFEKDYVAALRQSAESLQLAAGRRGPKSTDSAPAQDLWRIHLTEAETHRDATCHRIGQALNYYMASTSCLESGVSTGKDYLASHRPRVSPRYLLQFLARDKWDCLPEGWKQCLVQYAKRIHDVQRLQRIVCAASRNDHAALASELNNPGHTNWDPVDHPDSLLLEVESGLTIRNVQEEIAAQMRTPPEGDNAVMQLNMGEGKSSVIVPIVAAALADGTRLVRVIVAKPQSQQMLQMLTSKLGGMLNRVVFQMPFSRALRVSNSEAQAIQSLLKRCRDEGGVLLVQPEHILSLELMGKEYAMDENKLDTGRSLTMTRHFLHRHARDIVDESDENFSVKFELVYTMGEQQNIDHGSKRWKTIQEVLDIIRAAAPSVLERFPDSMEIYDLAAQPGSFPRTRVLRSDAMDQLLDHIVSYICDQGLTDFPLPRQVPALREAVRTYLTKPDLSDEEIECVEREGAGGFWTEAVKPTLVLLRGLIACNVLSFAFMQKRWRVNYGTALTRTPATRLAVPYLAKDRPSPRSEFSHPDVVIILTCLSYYYSGLSDDDLFLVFDHLLKADQPEVEYAAWARDNPQMPPKFRSLAGVNVEDRHQCMAHIFPHLRSTKSVIDYFLDRIVFEKEMREFLQTLGLDLAEQKHTNALVLGYLLQPETSVTDIPARSANQATDADALLDLVVGLEPPVRVILDVGAQVLELSNLQVAQQWLGRVMDDRTQGVVFFDDNDELSVLDRSGYVERLQTSPFASKLDVCLVFLDEAHTRGTDLKLPKDYRAAVTLGANQTKDGLMQGCMRMRKLDMDNPSSFAYHERSESRSGEEIKVSDILIWSIRETWISLQRGVQLWASQGWRHQRHQNLWVQSTQHEEPLAENEALHFLEDEALTILQRYKPERPGERHLGSLGEEQERELDPETERERELERPPPTAPAKHSLHGDVQQFVLTGALPSSSPGYMRAFKSLDSTQAGKEFGMAYFPETRAPTLLVSSDFATTVSIPKHQKIALDHYLRSVQWVVTNKGQLGVPSLDNLRLFTYPEPVKAKVPRVLTVGLNVFAGQLYFNDHKMYVATCRFLGLSWQKAREGEELDADGFMAKDQRGRVGGKSGFYKSPIRLMRDLMEIRYGSQASPRTHMGAMLGNRLLSEKDFEGEERT